MRTLYQLVCRGQVRFFEGEHFIHSRLVFESKDEAEDYKCEFIKECTTERFPGELLVMDIRKADKIKVEVCEVELVVEDIG